MLDALAAGGNFPGVLPQSLRKSSSCSTIYLGKNWFMVPWECFQMTPQLASHTWGTPWNVFLWLSTITSPTEVIVDMNGWWRFSKSGYIRFPWVPIQNAIFCFLERSVASWNYFQGSRPSSNLSLCQNTFLLCSANSRMCNNHIGRFPNLSLHGHYCIFAKAAADSWSNHYQICFTVRSVVLSDRLWSATRSDRCGCKFSKIEYDPSELRSSRFILRGC